MIPLQLQFYRGVTKLDTVSSHLRDRLHPLRRLRMNPTLLHLDIIILLILHAIRNSTSRILETELLHQRQMIPRLLDPAESSRPFWRRPSVRSERQCTLVEGERETEYVTFVPVRLSPDDAFRKRLEDSEFSESGEFRRTGEKRRGEFGDEIAVIQFDVLE